MDINVKLFLVHYLYSQYKEKKNKFWYRPFLIYFVIMYIQMEFSLKWIERIKLLFLRAKNLKFLYVLNFCIWTIIQLSLAKPKKPFDLIALFDVKSLNCFQYFFSSPFPKEMDMKLFIFGQCKNLKLNFSNTK